MESVTVILDTNVFIAGYWSGRSASARLVRACIEGRLAACYTRQIKAEVMRLLRMIKVPAEYISYIETYWEKAEEVVPKSVDPIRSADPEDQKFLEAAAGAGADFLVSNDEHLLSIGFVGRTEILTPGSAVRLLGG